MNLLIVESPNKIKKLKSILGDGWNVAASIGHIRDLPQKKLGIANDGEPEYIYIPDKTYKGRAFPGGAARIKKIKILSQSADKVYLATDPDREGEAIAWHLKVALRLKEGAYLRVTFGSISQQVVKDAIETPRMIDMPMVRAQEARRVLDRGFGYLVSPVISDFLNCQASAGRVQSPAVRLVVNRDLEIERFQKTSHFGARLTFTTNEKKWAAEWETNNKTNGSDYILERDIAEEACLIKELSVIESSTKIRKQSPPPPFSTSLLLQSASTELKMDPERTAVLAQKLFDIGAITYIRTDSVNFESEATDNIRLYAQSKGLAVPDKPQKYKTKGDAQEGHEAIRPEDISKEVVTEDNEQQRLYQLIRDRAIASQLEDALHNDATIRLEGGNGFIFKAKGSTIERAGWKAVYVVEQEEERLTLPVIEEGVQVNPDKGEVLEKQTKPPARFTKASLIARLEKEGIGRPSTYPAIMKNILGKKYIGEKQGFLFAEKTGQVLIEALVSAGFSFIDLGYTRAMEEDLDKIASGESSFESLVPDLLHKLNHEIEAFEGREGAPVKHLCPKCELRMKRFELKSKKGFIWICPDEKCKTFMPDKDGTPIIEEEHLCPTCKKAPLRKYEKKKNEGAGWFCTDKECTTFLDDKNGSPVEAPKATCPDCEKPMIRRNGKSGYWWGCSGFSDGCKKTMQDDNGKAIEGEDY